MREWYEREVAKENARRVAAYKLAVAGWVNCSGQDVSMGIPPRPFPAVPPKQVLVEVEGEFSAVDSNEFACAPLIKWGNADGTVISTPLPVRTPGVAFTRG